MHAVRDGNLPKQEPSDKGWVLFSQGHSGCQSLGEVLLKISNGLQPHRSFCYLKIFPSKESDSLLPSWAVELSDLSGLTGLVLMRMSKIRLF